MKNAKHHGIQPLRRPHPDDAEWALPATRRRPRRARKVHVHTGRPATPAPCGLVTSPHALASSAGINVLRAGGSAVDGAIATGAALAVLYPHMTGIGGDAFWLIHEGKSGTIRYLAGGGQAAALASSAWFRDRGHSEIPLKGIVPATLTVPGAPASWAEAHARFGRLPLQRCLDQAIGYAREGAPVTARLARFLGNAKTELAAFPDTAAIFLAGGDVPKAGSRLVNENLARSLEAFAHAGWAGFYAGEVAREMARFAGENGGFFREHDFAAQKAPWGEPLVGTYRGVTIYNTPAPTQGLAVLSMLNLLEPFELYRHTLLGPDYVHLLVQAKQLAYHDRDRFLADPRFVDVPIERLISKPHADDKRALMDLRKALTWDEVPSHGSLAGDTVYVAVVDKEGNAVSLIQSLYGAFGSAVVAGRTGILLHNRGAYFTLDPAHRNALQPGKGTAAYLDRIHGQARRQALERARVHGRGRSAASAAAGLHSHDRPWPRHPAGRGNAPLSVRPLCHR